MADPYEKKTGEGIRPSKKKPANRSQYAESLGQAAGYAGTAYQGASAGDYGSAILGGAASGATVGSMFGPWGTAIGGVLGAAGGAIGTAVSDSNKEGDWQGSMLKKTADLNYKTMMQNYLKQKRDSQWETDFRNRLRFGSK
jgi:hypothetical protein